jgi:hypothetical protein
MPAQGCADCLLHVLLLFAGNEFCERYSYMGNFKR